MFIHVTFRGEMKNDLLRLEIGHRMFHFKATKPWWHVINWCCNAYVAQSTEHSVERHVSLRLVHVFQPFSLYSWISVLNLHSIRITYFASLFGTSANLIADYRSGSKRCGQFARVCRTFRRCGRRWRLTNIKNIKYIHICFCICLPCAGASACVSGQKVWNGPSYAFVEICIKKSYHTHIHDASLSFASGWAH